MSAREHARILVFGTKRYPLAVRISLALAHVGFLVATLTHPGHPVRQARSIQCHFPYHRRFWFSSILKAIDRWSPDLIVCTDDLAVRILQTVHQRVAAYGDEAGRRISGLIERSLGPPTSFPAMRDKSAFLALAEIEGLLCPKTIVIPASRAFEPADSEITYPVVVKADHSDGGRCVRTANRNADLRAVVWELQTPDNWWARRFLGLVLGSKALGALKLPLRRTISLQQYVFGRPSNRAVICWKGKVLAGISVEAIEITQDHGPASVVRVIEHPEMTQACERMVERLQLSGFVGFDFILDSTNRAWLLEMNPRVTQTCHFVLADGTDLAASLCAQMNRVPTRSQPAPVYRDLVALFPNEMLRSPSSQYLKSCQHDVPRDEPELVRCMLSQGMRIRTPRRLRMFLERRFPLIADALVGCGLVGTRGGGVPREISPLPDDIAPFGGERALHVTTSAAGCFDIASSAISTAPVGGQTATVVAAENIVALSERREIGRKGSKV